MTLIETLWNQYHSELHTFLLARTHDHDDADDLLQEVFLRAWRKQHQLESTASARAWLYQITRHLLADRYRRPQLEVAPIESADSLINSPAEDEDPTDRPAVAAYVARLLTELPPTSRQAVMQADMASVSQKHLSQTWGVSYAAAKSRVQRARRQLRQQFERRCFAVTDNLNRVIGCEIRPDTSCCGKTAQAC